MKLLFLEPKIIFDELKNKFRKFLDISWCYYYRCRSYFSSPSIHFEFFDNMRNTSSPFIKLLLTGDSKTAIKDANRICKGEFRAYGIDPKIFQKDILWHKDYYSGFVWPLKPFNRIYDPNDSGADLNVPFELSRMQFVPTLIHAYYLTGNDGYLRTLFDNLDSWIAQNPFGIGINWWSCMEVGLRSVNMMLACVFLWKRVPLKKWQAYLKILWLHALYIYKYDILRDRIKNKNNHYLGAMLGLLSVSLCFKGNNARAYREYAIKAFRNEVPRQFYSDGGNFESATGYHQFSLEVILTAMLLLRTIHNNEPPNVVAIQSLGVDSVSRLLSGLSLVADYMATLGESPHIGDSSDCRALVFRDYLERKASDHSFLFDLGAIAIGAPILPLKKRFFSLYPYSGYAFLKTDEYGLVAWAGPKGTGGSGGHGHNDKCSFVLFVREIPVLVDPGTFIYNPNTESRFDLKKSIAHNIITIDEMEQTPITAERVFGLGGKLTTSINCNGKYPYRIHMEHDGFCSNATISRYERELLCLDESIRVEDRISGTGLHDISINFTFPPDITLEMIDSSIEVSGSFGSINIIFSSPFEINVYDAWYSKEYHERTLCKSIEARATLQFPANFTTWLKIRTMRIAEALTHQLI